MESILTKQGQENTGHHKVMTTIIDAGGLNWLKQRIDIGFVEGDKDLTPKVFIKIGKCDQTGQFKDIETKKGNKEIPQEFRTNNLDKLKELHKILWEYERMLRIENVMPIETYEAARYDYMKEVGRILRR